jgi:hypothetical protein
MRYSSGHSGVGTTRAIGDVAGYHRLAVADQEPADRRPQPVAADQRCAGERFSAFGPHRDAGRRFLEADDFL